MVSLSGQLPPVSPALTTASPGFLLSVIRLGLARTRKDLTEITGLARSTVGQRLGLLVEAGLLIEADGEESSGGRPPQILRFDPTAGRLLAANLTQTHLSAALTHLDGEPIAVRTSPVILADGPQAVLGHVCGEFRALLRATRTRASAVAGIGLGIPGPIEFSTGRVVRPPAMPGWDGATIPPYFSGFGVPVLVDNDVHLMALGEQERHHAGADPLVLVKVDSGIGSGIISRGEIFRGAQGASGGIGHIQLSEHADVLCTCGNRGCLAAVASGEALARRLTASGTNAATTQDVVDLVRAGHPDAVELVRQAGRDIGCVIAGMVNILNPSVVVIGGALARTDDVLLAGVRECIYRRSPPLATRELQIRASLLGEEAGRCGAALLVARHVLAPGFIDARLGYGPAREGGDGSGPTAARPPVPRQPAPPRPRRADAASAAPRRSRAGSPRPWT